MYLWTNITLLLSLLQQIKQRRLLKNYQISQPQQILSGPFVSFWVWGSLEDYLMIAVTSNPTPGAHLVLWTRAGSPDPAHMRSNLKSNCHVLYSRPFLSRLEDLLFLGDPAKRSPGRDPCFILTVGILTEWRGNVLLTGGPSAPARPAIPGFPCGPWADEAINATFNDQT